MPQIDVSYIPPLKVVAIGFWTAAGRVEDTSGPLRAAVETIIAPSIRMNFDAGGRPPWTPLADTTLEHSRRESAYGPLVVTGNLRDTASSSHVWTFSNKEAKMDSSRFGMARYGVFHQAGTRLMPARPFAVMQPEDEVKMDQVFDSWLGDIWASAGFVSEGSGQFPRFFGAFR